MDMIAARTHMIEGQIRIDDVTDSALMTVLSQTAREAFVPGAAVDLAYADVEIEVAPGRYLLRPRDFAKLVQALDVRSADRVLVLGAAMGYGVAVLSQLAAEVVGIEPDAKLANHAQKALKAGGHKASVLVAPLDAVPGKLGAFDAILVEGAVAEVPAEWARLLVPGGRLAVVERQGHSGRAKLFVRSGAGLSGRDMFDAQAQFLPGLEPKAGFVF